jgi:hypothetical protein
MSNLPGRFGIGGQRYLKQELQNSESVTVISD